MDVKKTDLARTIARSGRFQMKPIAEALEISHSHLTMSLSAESDRKSEKYFSKIDAHADKKLAADLKEIVKERPSYGYRRACAVLNRKFVSCGQKKVNHKRLYRVMKIEKLLLPKHVGFKPERKH